MHGPRRMAFPCWRKRRPSTIIGSGPIMGAGQSRPRTGGRAGGGFSRPDRPQLRDQKLSEFARMWNDTHGRMCMFTTGGLAALASISLAAIAMPAFAADVTYERLLNAPNDPANWLMVHRDYNNSRHSPLTDVNLANAKDLKLKFLMSIGGRATGGTLRGKEESTPLVEDGFMYVADTWTRVMKFDVRNGTNAVPLWRYDPKITRSRTNRGIALYGDKVIVSTNDMRLIAIKKDSGELAWEVNAAAPTDPATGTPSPRTQGFTGAPLAVKTAGGKELIVQGESTGGQLGTRSWVGAFDVNTGQLAWRAFTIPAPGEP